MSATTSAADPMPGISPYLRRLVAGARVLELRRALRDQRVAVPDERAALELAGDDDLAALAERVRHDAGVGDRHRRGSVAVAHGKREALAAALDRPVDALAGQLVLAAALLGQQRRRRGGRGVRREAREHQPAGQQHGCAEGDEQADLALAGGVHATAGRIIAGRMAPLRSTGVEPPRAQPGEPPPARWLECPSPGQGPRISTSRASSEAEISRRSLGSNWARKPAPPLTDSSPWETSICPETTTR